MKTSIGNLTINYNLSNLINLKIPLVIKGEECEIKLHDSPTNNRIFLDNFYINDDYKIIGNKHQGNFNCNYDKNAKASGNFIYKKTTFQISDCNLYSGSQKEFAINFLLKRDNQGNIKSAISEGFIKKLPLVQKELWYLLIDDPDINLYFNSIIQEGEVFNSSWKIHLSSEFFKKHKFSHADKIEGIFNVQNATILYDGDFAPLTNLNGTIKLEEKIITLDVISANILNTKIINGTGIIDHQDHSAIALKCSGSAEGPAIDLFNYIPTSQKNKMEQARIFVSEFQGKAFTIFNITVPFDMKIKNYYDVTSTVKSNKSIISNEYTLNNIFLNLKVDSNNLYVSLDGKFFDQPLTAKYNYVFTDEIPFSHSLLVDVKILPHLDTFNNLRIMDVKDGIGNINVKLTFDNQDIGTLAINGDLTNNTLFFNKIGVTKDAFKKLIIKAAGTLDEYNLRPINFNIIGDDNLNIKGNVIITDKMSWRFDHVKYLENDFRSNIITSEDSSEINITGQSLDLSKIDLTQFITKQSNKSNVTSIKVKTIKLKSDVYFQDFDFGINCDKTKCNSGFMATKILSKDNIPGYTTMMLKSYEDYEMWTINTNNLGANMQAIGLYKSLNNGTAEFIIKSSRKTAALGDLIPILEGHFTITNFSTSDVNFALKLITLTSFRGLINVVGSKKNIPFSKAKGEFNFDNNTIKILNSDIDGPYFDFTSKGTIDIKQRLIKIGGAVAPSLYGVNIILRKFPGLGKIFSNGIIFAPYKQTINY